MKDSLWRVFSISKRSGREKKNEITEDKNNLDDTREYVVDRNDVEGKLYFCLADTSCIIILASKQSPPKREIERERCRLLVYLPTTALWAKV